MDWLILLGIMIVLFIISRFAEQKALEMEVKKQLQCPPHAWVVKKLDPKKPDEGDFLVCKKCKWVPGSDSYL